MFFSSLVKSNLSFKLNIQKQPWPRLFLNWVQVAYTFPDTSCRMLSSVNVFSHIPQAIKTRFSKLQRALNENLRSCTPAGAFSSQLSQLGDVSCGSAFTGVGIRGKKGRRMKREKRRAQGHFKTSSLCLQLTGQGKRKPTETTACQRNKQTQQQISSLFLGAEQSTKNCHKIILSPYLKGKKNPIFNMVLFFLPIS